MPKGESAEERHRDWTGESEGQPGLSSPAEAKPPPIQEVVRVPVDDEGREFHAG